MCVGLCIYMYVHIVITLGSKAASLPPMESWHERIDRTVTKPARVLAPLGAAA